MDGEQHPPPRGGDGVTRASILGAPRQRRILSILREHSRPTTVDELGVRLAADAPSDATEAELEPIRADLRHRCLPKLESAGWIERCPEGYRLDEPLPLGTERLSLPPLEEPEHPSWEVASVLLARPYRQDILSIVGDRRDPLTVTELATELRGCGAFSADERNLAINLHHVDLPTLADLGVLEYDRDDRTVERTPRLLTCVDRLDLDTE
jgi:hypothetical protein